MILNFFFKSKKEKKKKLHFVFFFFSTVSTGVNSLAAIWFAELEGTDFKSKLTAKKAGLTVKGLALLFGLSSFALVFVVPFMGSLVPVSRGDHKSKKKKGKICEAEIQQKPGIYYIL